MKTINSEEKDYEIFLDPTTNEYVGFAGKVKVHDSEIYVNTKSGKGYDKVIKKLGKLIHFLSTKYHLKGFALEDSKQHIAMRILEGIPKFDPRKGVKLSTFLQMRINRRLINELRDQNHSSKNATYLNINSYNYLCGCGNSFTITLTEEENETERVCEKCNSSTNKARKVSVGFSEVSLDSYAVFNNSNETDEDVGNYDSFIENENVLDEDDIILKHDINSWLENHDPIMAKLFNLILLQDYSVSRAAEKLGISNACASLKLKKLKDDEKFMEMINKQNG